MRKLIIALVLMVGIMFVLTKFAEIEDIVATLEKGDWRYLGLAAMVEVLWIINIGASWLFGISRGKATYRGVVIRQSRDNLQDQGRDAETKYRSAKCHNNAVWLF
jgi:uncharacterized membrane protein YbhN (UPF0104 family)